MTSIYVRIYIEVSFHACAMNRGGRPPNQKSEDPFSTACGAPPVSSGTTSVVLIAFAVGAIHLRTDDHSDWCSTNAQAVHDIS